MQQKLEIIHFSECGCNLQGTECKDIDTCIPTSILESLKDITCDNDGKCNCRCNIKGDKCDGCNAEFWSYPHCHGKTILRNNIFNFFSTNLDIFSTLECQCNEHGSENVFCDDNGICTCKTDFTGDKCDQCIDGSQDCFTSKTFTILCSLPIFHQICTSRF